VTLLDEPFAALDAPSIRCVSAALVRAAGQPHRTCVIADYQAPSGVPLAAAKALAAALLPGVAGAEAGVDAACWL
ncbi:MAG: hypothetical protein K2Y26_13220, partial [Gemmatimonadaceae bacterium]|nr:hypothetical protein [Gemmatimonadaceae bacterium]